MNIVSIAVGLAGLLMVGGIVAMIISGIKSVVQGKQDFKRIGIMMIPVLVFAVSYFVFERDEVIAAVMTAGVMMAGMALGIVFTGLKGTLRF